MRAAVVNRIPSGRRTTSAGDRVVVRCVTTPLVIGFAAETEKVEEHARAKIAKKGCDWIVANDVSFPGVMGGADNTVLLVTAEGAEPWPTLSKAEVARRLAERIATALA